MSLMEQAINTVIDTKAAAEKEAQKRVRDKAHKTAAWLSETLGIDATWVKSDTDIVYVQRTDSFGYKKWVEEQQFRHRIKVDDVLLGVSYGRYGGDTIPTVEVVYRPCGECGNETPLRLYGFHDARHRTASTEEKQQRALQSLLLALGKVLTSSVRCTTCEARPCRECGHV